MYQTGDTIKQTLEDIRQNKFVLPAIQREFVWQPEQIAKLFDRLMQGYPFGTFLFWKVDRHGGFAPSVGYLSSEPSFAQTRTGDLVAFLADADLVSKVIVVCS